ncbi:MAG: leucine-rich repeat domain-containing protein, partial [Planctomycetaceae bacterium]
RRVRFAAQGYAVYPCFYFPLSFVFRQVCVMNCWKPSTLAPVMSALLFCSACSRPAAPTSAPAPGTSEAAAGSGTAPAVQPKAAPQAGPAATAASADVQAARARLDAMPRATYAPKTGDLLTEISIGDCSPVTAEDVALFGRLTDLKKLQLINFRALNDEPAGQLLGLSQLTSLSLTNSVITDAAVERVIKSLPNLVELDLSSNTNMSSGVMKILGEQPRLQRLSLVQNKINDIGAQRLAKFPDLKSLDLRGNMEAGDMALEVLAGLSKLNSLKHRSTAVTDAGLESLSACPALDSLLIQDFAITDQSGPHLAKLPKLTQLEIFRCQGFGSQGVLALKGTGLTRLTLRDLPNVYDQGLEVFDELPKLKRLFLHELSSVGDAGLSHLAKLEALEQLDIWVVPQLTDATIDVIAQLPNLKTLSIRSTGVTDACIDKLLALKSVQSLTFKENGAVSDAARDRLKTRQWGKLDLGGGPASEE